MVANQRAKYSTRFLYNLNIALICNFLKNMCEKAVFWKEVLRLGVGVRLQKSWLFLPLQLQLRQLREGASKIFTYLKSREEHNWCSF